MNVKIIEVNLKLLFLTDTIKQKINKMAILYLFKSNDFVKHFTSFMYIIIVVKITSF